MRNIPTIIHSDKFEITEYWRKVLKQAVTDNDSQPIRAQIVPLTIESRKQRKYLMGALLPLWVYLDGGDHKDSEMCGRYFEDFKLEYFPEAIKIKGKVKLFGKSSKGSKMLSAVIDRMIDMLVEHYGLEYGSPVLLPDVYKNFRDELFSTGPWESFLDYAISMKWINKDKI